MNKIDFNNSKDIDYSGMFQDIQVFMQRFRYLCRNVEFLVAAIPLAKIINDKTLESAFRVIDSDLSGKLSPQELKDHLGEHVSQVHYQKILSFYDLDKDGEVTMW